jgi:hypothetical protein
MEMGGHVAKKLGDGLMALFGYPLAHENDAECQSALKWTPKHNLPAEPCKRCVGVGDKEAEHQC